MTDTVLCYIEQNEKYLMLHRTKKRVDINKGKWVGVGGHVEADETPDEALLREVKEETGLTITSYVLRGIVVFYIDDYIERAFLYTASDFFGKLIDCDEGELAWIEKLNVLSLNLWEGDKLFLPALIEGKEYFELDLYYENDVFIRHAYREV